MRILMIGTGVFPIPPPRGGGTENHIYHLVNTLAELDHEIHLISNVSDNAHFHKNITIYPVNTPPPSFKAGITGWMKNHLLGGISIAKKVLSRVAHHIELFDVIHVHGRLSGFLSSLIIKNILKADKPLVYTVHDSPPWHCFYESTFERIVRYAAYHIMELRTSKIADAVITVSKMIAKIITTECKVPDHKVYVIPNGVDTSIFRPALKKGDFCLFVGQLTRRKGIRYLLHALKMLDDSIKCVIVGEGPDRKCMEMRAKKIGLNNVKFLGAVSNEKLIELYSKAAVFVFPSLSEGLPLSIIEAMSCGCPVIAFDVGGISEVIKNGYNGFLIKPKDTKALANYLKLLMFDDDLRRNMSINARRRAQQYDWKIIATKILGVYDRILHMHRYRQ